MTATELANYGNALPSLSSPIAESGDKRTPISGISNETDTQASVKFGLPALMSEPIDQDGIPVPRQDLNGIYNLLSKIVHFLMAGGRIPYMASESIAIGGYPAGAEVSYQGHNYRSLIDSNTAVPTDTTKWTCIDYLPLTGGTVSGTIVSTAYENGKPSLEGQNGITISVGSEENKKLLTLRVDGGLVWNGRYVAKSLNGVDADINGEVSYPCWPNYSARYGILNGWTATSNGWIQAKSGTAYQHFVIAIDGLEVARAFDRDYDTSGAQREMDSFLIPIAKGSAVTWQNAEYVYFIPAKVS